MSSKAKSTKRKAKRGKTRRGSRSKGRRPTQLQLGCLSVEEIALDRSAAYSAARKRQHAKMGKVTCRKCGYVIRVARSWALKGLPICGVAKSHGRMTTADPLLVAAMEEANDE